MKYNILKIRNKTLSTVNDYFNINFLKFQKKNSDFIIEVYNEYNPKKINNKFLRNNFYEIFLINSEKLKKINSFSQFPIKSSGGHLFF